MKVCVIGAGAAGLCATRHLMANPRNFEFTVYEKSSDIGGTWIYTDNIGLDDNGLPVHSSMYKNLRTNLPKEIMSFPDFPEMKGENKSCVKHDTVLNYLKEYADHFSLRQHIQFNTSVEYVELLPSTDKCSSERWKVKVKDIKSCQLREEIYDAIIVCNGHYFEPHIPSIHGIDNFQGQIIHSHDYRTPEDFTGKTVLILGASSSGIDIAFELSDKASQVYLSHDNERLGNSFGITEVQGIEKYENGAFVLKNSEQLRNVDVLLYCTGYHFSYPFLDDNCHIHVDDNYVSPLYKHLINVEHPTMCLVGVPLVVVPFPMFHVQIKYFLSLLIGETHLPSKKEMMMDARLKTMRKRHAHKLASAQWVYNDELAREANFQTLPPYYRIGYETWSQLRKRDLRDYKRYDLVIEDDGQKVHVEMNQ